MSILDKLQFWKKKDDVYEDSGYTPAPLTPSFDDSASDLPPRPSSSDPFASKDYKSSFDEPGPAPYTSPLSPPSPTTPSSSREMELINAKLDTLKAMMETIMQRLDKKDKDDQW